MIYEMREVFALALLLDLVLLISIDYCYLTGVRRRARVFDSSVFIILTRL